MKKRIQLDAEFADTVANDILNHIESIKTKIFKPSAFTPVEIIRFAQQELSVNEFDDSVIISFVSFDSEVATHNSIDASGLCVKIDISFISESDAIAFVNYIETKKSLYIGTYASCRFFDCRHDENPLQKDGSYTYIDFDGSVLTHS